MLIHHALEKIDHLLIEYKILNQIELLKYKSLATEKNQSLLHLLSAGKIINEKIYTQILCQAFSLTEEKSIKLDYSQIDFAILNKNEIKQTLIIPVKSADKHILILHDPSNIAHINLVKFRCSKPIHYQLISLTLLQKIISEIEIQHFSPEPEISINNNFNIIHIENNPHDPLVDFINLILFSAIQKKASDIHFEPYQNHYRIRLRINGLLQELSNTERHADHRIAARLKVMANLDTTEKRLPQDGQLQIQFQNQHYPARISTCPTIYGEKIVLRLLHMENRNINQLGMSSNQLNLFLSAIKKPQGLILVCGPTGSGKTITLYAALQYLNHPQANILTIEDPVEIKLNGINQVAINAAVKLTFQRALRSFLRLDPDIIMVGEIRDTETAKITIKAAQTGHLVLSTLHSNSALKALTRLRQMGINDYDIIDATSLIISQRLLRKLCPHCKVADTLSNNSKAYFRLPTDLSIYKAQGCQYCQQGYQGRFAVYEIIPFSNKLIDAFLANSTISQLEKCLPDLQIPSLYDAALEAVKQGLTTIEEIQRVVIE